MLYDELKNYLDAVEQAILGCDGVYVARCTEDFLILGRGKRTDPPSICN